jgi:hypothetical protein
VLGERWVGRLEEGGRGGRWGDRCGHGVLEDMAMAVEMGAACFCLWGKWGNEAQAGLTRRSAKIVGSRDSLGGGWRSGARDVPS